MTTILIADSGKASLVMSSEVFKDKLPGSSVFVARTGEEALSMVEKYRPEMCVVDFDLPDVDGVTLICEMRKTYRGPILLTAYPDKIVADAVSKHLFGFDDAGEWLPKPIKVDDLSAKIDRYLLSKQRVRHRFGAEFSTMLIGKGAGRGKRAPKAVGNVINLSLDGACVKLQKAMPMKIAEELTLSLHLPVPGKMEIVKPPKAQLAKGKKPVKGKNTRATPTLKRPKTVETKIKARVCWTKDGGHMAGLQLKLNDAQRKSIEAMLRDIAQSPLAS